MMKNDRKSQTAQALIEYALIIVLASLIVVIGITAFGKTTDDIYQGIVSSLQGKITPQAEEDESPAFNTTACEQEVKDIDNWQLVAKGKKDWACDGESLCVENNKSEDNFAFSKCSMEKSMPSDYEVEITNAVLKDGDGLNLMFRMQKYTSKPEGYSFTYDPNTNTFVLMKWVKGKQTPIASSPAGEFKQYGAAHNFKVQVEGTTINAYVDGTLVLTAQDATYASGGAGVHVGGENGAACFGNLTVRVAGE